MLMPILAVVIAVIFFIYYKHTHFYKKRLYPNLSWTCALALSTTTAWELAIQSLMDGVADTALIAKSEMLLAQVDNIFTAALVIAVALTLMLFLPTQSGSEKHKF